MRNPSSTLELLRNKRHPARQIKLARRSIAAQQTKDVESDSLDEINPQGIFASGRFIVDDDGATTYNSYGYKTAWLEAATGNMVAAGGNAVMSDKGFLATQVPIIFDSFDENYIHLLSFISYNNAEYLGVMNTAYNLIINKTTLGSNVVTGGDFETGWEDEWALGMPEDYELIEHEGGNALQLIIDTAVHNFMSCDANSIYLLEFDAYGEITVGVYDTGAYLLVYANSFSAWTKVTLAFRTGTPTTFTAAFFGGIYDMGASGTGAIDNVSIKKINDATGTIVDLDDNTVSVIGDLVDETGAAFAYVHPNHTGDVTSVGDGAQTIAAKAVTIAKLADGTDGELITWDADGHAAVVAAGTATHVLTSNGAGAAPTFQAPAGGGGDASDVTYTPGTAADWDVEPDYVDEGLDELAGRVTDLEDAQPAYKQLWVGGWKPALTNGCDYLQQIEMGTNKNVYDYLAFDDDNIEYAYANVAMPDDYTGGTILAKFYWAHPATTTNFKVSWGLQAVAFSDDDTLDAAQGTAQYANDVGGTTSDLYISPQTSAITIGGTPVAGDLVNFRVLRKADDATNDTLAVDAYLLGVMIWYPV